MHGVKGEHKKRLITRKLGEGKTENFGHHYKRSYIEKLLKSNAVSDSNQVEYFDSSKNAVYVCLVCQDLVKNISD
jgi:hypothetical protein